MNINVNALCNECFNCERLEIEQVIIYAEDKVYDRAFSCKHLQECLKTLKVWEKQNESNSNI